MCGQCVVSVGGVRARVRECDVKSKKKKIVLSIFVVVPFDLGQTTSLTNETAAPLQIRTPFFKSGRTDSGTASVVSLSHIFSS